jgi:hypothetical protein
MKTSMYSKLMTRAFAGLVTWVLLCGPAFTVNAQDYFVATNGNDSAAGTSWDVPLLTISNAIAKASAGQVVAVSNGTYVLTTQLLLNKGIKLQGFGGASNTIIDANASGRIATISSSTAILDGFTLKNGRSTTTSFNGTGINMTDGTIKNCIVSLCTNTYQYAKGIGVYMTAGTIDTCIIENNDGYGSLGGYGGGGVYMVTGVITNTALRGNRTQNYGGAIRMEGGMVVDCVASNNSAVCGTGGGLDAWGYGGGVYMSGGVVQNCFVVTNQTSSFNDSPSRGGGIYVAGTGTVVNCMLSGNRNLGINPIAMGGGLYMSGGLVIGTTVTNNTHVSAYQPTYGVGVCVANGGVVTNCTIINNNATLGASSRCYGGGIYVTNATVVDCTISINNVGGPNTFGGGAYIMGGVLRGSTVRDNSLKPSNAYYAYGGGIYVNGGGVVTNCIVSGNLIDGDDPHSRGGGVYIDTGSVVDSTIKSNSAAIRWGYTSYGGGAYLAAPGALLDRCTLFGNRVSRPVGSAINGFGGGIAMTNGTARNCLISGNESINTAGGVYVSGGTLENCTVVRNKGTVNYGGVYWTNSPSILNTIVYNNTGAIENNIMPIVGGINGVTYSCAPSLTSGTGNVIADPLFSDSGIGSGTSFTAGDYRPVIGSPCEKTGLVAGWMSTALELAGLPRLSSGLVTMGAYVAIPPKSTYVADSGNDLNAGTSWDAPFKTIQKGVDAATALGTVSVSNGTYVLTSQLQLGKGCTLLGLGGRSNTIINANATGRIITIDNANAVVDGFSLLYGKTATASFNGTGVNMTGGTLRNCLVSGCTNTAASAQGVGIYMTGGTVASCIIEKNSGTCNSGGALSSGGGIYMSGSGCLVTNCLISGNLIGEQWVASKGAGVYMSAGKVLDSVVTNNTLHAGRYGYGGGGLFITGSGAVSNCLIAANAVTCTDIKTYGGGVYAEGGSVTDCVVSNNSSQGFSPVNYTMGGGIYLTGSGLVERCVITKNYQNVGWTSARYGAGVGAEGGTMRNCLIMGNTANTAGGGLYITGGTNENCTIVRNNCSGGNYGGVYWTNTPVIVNAIVYNNTGAIENNILPVVNGLSQVTYSCAPSLTSGTGNVTGDPQFAASGSGYGTTFVAGDYRLVAGTPCLNKGLTELRMKTATDLDRLPRVKDFFVDMGAYERQITSGSMIKFF